MGTFSTPRITCTKKGIIGEHINILVNSEDLELSDEVKVRYTEMIDDVDIKELGMVRRVRLLAKEIF